MGNWLGWVASPFARKRKREIDDLPLQPAPAPAAPQPEPEPELSPEEQAHKKKKTALPKRGLKLAHLEATEEQNKEVEDARKLWSSQLDGDRVCSIVSVAKWHADKGLAEVTSVKGKWNLAMGFMRDGAFWLYPEEAVYLVDQSALELYYGGVPLTFQQCVAILAQCNFSWDRYFTYAHLKRTGLVVLRSNIYRLKQERDARDRARDEAAKAAQSVAPPPIVEPPPPAAAAPAAPVPAAAGPASPPAPALASLTTNGNELSVADSLMDGAAVAALFDQQAPNASPAPAAPPVPAPEAAASPVAPAPAPAPAPAAAAAPGGPAPKGQGQWRNKNNKNVREGEEPRVPRELLRAEPRIPGDLAPVADIRNRDEDILRQLQVIPRVTFRESVLPNPEAPVDFASPALCVDFDVYENNNKYKKSAPGVPAYRVAVCPFTDPVPSLRVIESLTRLAYPAPLKVAVVCSGVVLFNEFVSMYGQK